MNVFQLDYHRLPAWSPTDLAYISHDPRLRPFYTYEASLAAFRNVMEARKKFPVDRPLWLYELSNQYEKLNFTLPLADEVFLNENTFTVTTAHQPVLFTGALYHIYKIAGTIHLARALAKEYPGHQFIPMFVIGSEDHDWHEINHFHLFGKKYEWEKDAAGPGGRLSLDGLSTLIDSVEEKIGNTPYGKELTCMFRNAIERATTYGEFHQALLISLFHKHGLVVFHMDSPGLKRAFIPHFEREIKEQFSIQHVPATQHQLELSGFKPQAFCRPVNLFYMSPGRRERLDPVEGGIKRVESEVTYSMDEILKELHQHPENFSPNVILRPLYQEFILPNLAYIGGGGEIAYWLERKVQFAEAGVHFPMLIRRNSLMQIDENTSSQMQKADVRWEDLLDDYDAVVKSYLQRHSQTDLSFEAEEQLLQQAYADLASKAEKIDPTLATAILAEQHKQIKLFEQLASRLLRAEKQHQETNLKRIQKLKEKLFPDGGLQERQENFIGYYAVQGDAWLKAMIEICDPLEEKFTVVQL